MSKAFLRESDLPDPPELPPPASPLPPGVRNYLTPQGAQRLRDELHRWAEVERPRTAPLAATDPDAKRQLQSLDQRIRYLQDSLRTAEIVPPPAQADDVVRFGANVTVREGTSGDASYRLVGFDETEPERGWISWMSPLGRALLNARVGQLVTLKAPAGERVFEILTVNYDPV